MELTDEEKLRRFEVCKMIWPDAGMDENGEVCLPFTVDLSDCIASPNDVRTSRRPPRPSSEELPALVANAQSIITYNGGTAARPAAKRQQIDELSYSYGLLWGVACALNCSLRDVIDRFGPSTKKRQRSAREQR